MKIINCILLLIFLKAYNLSLAKVLYYSPNALNRIKMLIQGQNAYYVPGFLSDDDLAVTDFLNIPIFGSEPNVSW